jgi:hypothetical protein
MNEMIIRQMSLLRHLIADYHHGILDLNALIQRIEGIGEIINLIEWKSAIFPIILSMEQINAFVSNMKSGLTEADRVSIKNSLCELEALICRFETME